MFWKLNSCQSFANTLSHFVGCPFILFMVYFAVQKLLSLIKSHLFTFALGDDLRKHFYNFSQRMFCLCSLTGVL